MAGLSGTVGASCAERVQGGAGRARSRTRGRTLMARLADSLRQFRDEVDTRWPNRNKRSDGWLGDAAHQATPSDHNPNPQGVVCAFDLTHDPANGVDCNELFA